jgi:hypothetical protein
MTKRPDVSLWMVPFLSFGCKRYRQAQSLPFAHKHPRRSACPPRPIVEACGVVPCCRRYRHAQSLPFAHKHPRRSACPGSIVRAYGVVPRKCYRQAQLLPFAHKHPRRSDCPRPIVEACVIAALLRARQYLERGMPSKVDKRRPRMS